MGCHPSHWRTPSFFKMVKTTFVRNDEWWKWIELETHDVIHLRVSFRKREEWLVLVGTRTFQKENEGNARAFVAWSAAMLRNMGCLRCLPPQSMLKNVCCPKSWFFQPFWVRSETTWSCDLQEFRWLKFITSTKVRKQLRREHSFYIPQFDYHYLLGWILNFFPQYSHWWLCFDILMAWF